MKSAESRDLQIRPVVAPPPLVLFQGLAAVLVPLEAHIELNSGFLVIGPYGILSPGGRFNVCGLLRERSRRATRAGMALRRASAGRRTSGQARR